MSVRSEIIRRQARWAHVAGYSLDASGYLSSVELNLRQPLNAKSRLAFEKGSGSELKDSPRGPAKAKAPHSSSVLAINFFDYWVDKDTRSLMAALALPPEPVEVRFEEQFPTGLGSIPPNLDVALVRQNGFVHAIESKFTEWVTPKSATKLPLKDKYFASGAEVWSAVGLPDTQQLAERMQSREILFRYLDAAQLAKHALGLASNLGRNFQLLYLYFDGLGSEPAAIAHRSEISQFFEQVGSELGFLAMSYQDLLDRLHANDEVDREYCLYLQSRYRWDDAEQIAAGDV